MRDRAKASSTGRAPDLLRSEYLRMDKTAATASSALRSKKSPSPSASEPFLFDSSALEEGGSTLYAGGIPNSDRHDLQRMFSSLPEESFAFAAEPEQGCELRALGTSAGGYNTCPGIRTWAEGEEEDTPSFGTLPQARRSFSTEFEVFRFTLRDFRDSISTRARSSPLVGLATEGPVGENFIEEGGEGLKAAERVDLKLEGPRISDLINSE